MESSERWFVVPVNAEPWAIGPVTVGRKGKGYYPIVGRNNKVASYQEALRDVLEGAGVLEGEVEIKLFIWRRLDTALTFDGKKHRAHQSDATNIQKATEDAIQNILIQDDRLVRRVSTEIVEQDSIVEPCVVIMVRPYELFDPSVIPEMVWASVDRAQGINTQQALPIAWDDPESSPANDSDETIQRVEDAF